MAGCLFHRLVVQLSTSSTPLPVDRLLHLGNKSVVQEVLSNHPTIFYSFGSCYTISSTSPAFLLATYLSLSSNVTWLSTKQTLTPYVQSPTMMVKSKSTHVNLVSSILPDKPNHLVISLPDGTSYQVPSTIHQEDSCPVPASGSPLFANIKFAVNSCQQLMCLVINLSCGEGRWLTSNESKLTHIPIWKEREENTERSRVVVRSDLVSKHKQVDQLEVQLQQLLVFEVWKLMLKIEHNKVGGGECECSIVEIVKKLSKQGLETANDEILLGVVGQYRDLFTVSGLQISLQPTSHSYWSQMLLLCYNLTTATGLDHVPLSPSQLGVTLGNNTVVLRHLQGMAFPCDKIEKNIFRVSFRFPEAGDGFSVKLLHNSQLKVPAEGKLIPLTLVIQTNRFRVWVVGTLGSWREFEINWPKDEISFKVEDDLELLLDAAPVLSSAVGDENNDIVTLEEEN